MVGGGAVKKRGGASEVGGVNYQIKGRWPEGSEGLQSKKGKVPGRSEGL